MEKRYLRDYPYQELGAQLFGTLREISPSELKQRRYRGVAAGTRSARTASRRPTTSTCAAWTATRASSSTRSATATTRGRRPAAPDPGRPAAADARPRAAARGQRRDEARHRRREPARQRRQGGRLRRDGSPQRRGARARLLSELRREPVRQAALPVQFDQLNSQANGAPLFNRAIAATYPTGSTFKPITAMAALESGIIDTGSIITDTGSFQLGNLLLQNARGASYGPLKSPRRSRSPPTSSSTRSASGRTRCRARSSRRGHASSASAGPTGIDIPGEPKGLVPDADGATRLRGVPAVREAQPRRGAHERGPVRVRRHRAPAGPPATTSTSRSARATCRRRRCRWRSPTRRS